MRGELSVTHETITTQELKERLEDKFGAHDASVTEKVTVLAGQTAWKARIIFAAEHPDYRLACYPVTNQHLQLILEPVHGQIRRACQSVWDAIRQALSDRRPNLSSAELIDQFTGRPVMSGQTGLVVELKRQEVLASLFAAVATAVWVGVGVLTFAQNSRWEFAGGGVTSWISGFVGLAFAGIGWRRSKLRWHM